MNNQSGLKKILSLIITVAVVVLVAKWCTKNLGSVITLPGGLGNESTEGTSSEESGGWFSPKKQTGGTTTTIDDMDIKDLERELGVGTNKGTTTSTTTTTPSTTSTTSTSSAPLSFKGIPMTGTLTAFGNELVKAGFRSAGNGTYTGDFAGYSGCKVTPSGSNPVQEVRIDFPVISDWNALEKAYDSLQASLTEKYGIQPQTATNSNVAVYDLPNGTITLDADVSNQANWHVILKYSNPLGVTTTNTGTLGRNPIDDL